MKISLIRVKLYFELISNYDLENRKHLYIIYSRKVVLIIAYIRVALKFVGRKTFRLINDYILLECKEKAHNFDDTINTFLHKKHNI